MAVSADPDRLLRVEFTEFFHVIGVYEDRDLRGLAEDALRRAATAAGREPPVIPARSPPGQAPSAYREDRKDRLGWLMFRVFAATLVGTVSGGVAAAAVAEDLVTEMTKASITSLAASLGGETVLRIQQSIRR